MNRTAFFVVFFLASITFFSQPLLAQTTGDYRSVALGGQWQLAATWETFNGTTWVAASTYPTQRATLQSPVIIPSGTTITLTNGTGSEITFSSGGSLSVSGTLELSNSTTTSGATASNLTFTSTGRLRHLYTTTEGTIPLATWNAGATLELAGYTGNIDFTSAGNWGQSFANIIVNCPNLANSRTVNAKGLLTSMQNLTITTTGSGTSGAFRLIDSQTSTAAISGMLTVNAGIFRLNDNGNLTLNIGSFSMSGGTMYLADANNGVTNINVTGNFSFTGGALDRTANTGTANINFTGTTLQTYTRTGGTLPSATNKPVGFTIAAGATVDMGTSSFTGAGTFTLNGTVRVGSTSANGPFTTGGNIATTGKVYNSGSTIVFSGTALQYTGIISVFPSSSGITARIDNSSGVDIVGSISIAGNLELISGDLNVGASETLTLGGNVTQNSTNENITVTSTSSIVVNGSGDFGTFPFPTTPQTFQNFTLNRSGALSFATDVTLSGTLTLTNGTLIFSDQDLTLNGPYSASAGLLSANAGATLTIGGSGSVSTLTFLSGGNTLNTLTIDRGGEIVSMGSSLTITGVMNLNNGTLSPIAHTIIMQGSQWNTNGGTFLIGTSHVLFQGNTVLQGLNAPEFYDLTLSDGAAVTFYAGDTYIANDLTLSATGTFVHNDGGVHLNGSDNQSVNGGNHEFHDITVSNTGGNIILTGGVNLNSVLSITTPVVFQSAGFLQLRSTGDDPDVTALIAALPAGASVTGDVIVQRYMSGENRIYRYLSSPVQNATVADWKDDFAITGTFADPTPATTICGVTIKPTSPSMYRYNETAAGITDNGWEAYPTSGTAASNPLQVGRGYSPFIRECAAPTIIDITGVINSGTISLPVTYTNSGTPAADGFNLVGNPYPAPIVWDVDGNGWNKTNISAVVAVRDNGGGGGFVYYDEADANGVISLGQAFWVQTTGSAPALQVTENAKATAPGTFYRVASEVRDLLQISLSNNGKTDHAYFRIKEAASDGADRNDFAKLANDFFDVATTSIDGTPLAVNAVGELSCERSLSIFVRNLKTGNYALAFSREGVLEAYDIVLTDNFTGTTTVIGPATPYNFSVTSAAASKASNRFQLQLKRSSIHTDIAVEVGEGIACQQADYAISLSGVQPYNTYSVVREGVIISTAVADADEVVLNIPSGEIANGLNSFVIQVSNGCEVQNLGSPVTIDKETAVNASGYSDGIICNEGSATLKVDKPKSTLVYNWYEDNAAPESIHVGTSYNTPVLKSAATYYVSATNRLGCEGERSPISVQVDNYVDAVINALSRNVLQSNYASGNQWYFNEQIIAGATGQTLKAMKQGVYSLTVHVGQCTTTASFTLIGTAAVELTDHEALTIFPNDPANRANEINVRVLAEAAYQGKVIDALGNVIATIKLDEASSSVWTGAISVNNLPPGVYLISIETNAGMLQTKMIR